MMIPRLRMPQPQCMEIPPIFEMNRNLFACILPYISSRAFHLGLPRDAQHNFFVIDQPILCRTQNRVTFGVYDLPCPRVLNGSAQAPTAFELG